MAYLITEKIDLFRKYILSGNDPNVAKEILNKIAIEDIIFQLSRLPSESFITTDDEYDGLLDDYSTLDEKYIGNIIVRVLDSLITPSHYERIFSNDEVIEIIRKCIEDGVTYYVRKMISRHIKNYFVQGGQNVILEELVWSMLFDESYPIFDFSAQAIRAIVQRNPKYLNDKRINDVINKTHSIATPRDRGEDGDGDECRVKDVTSSGLPAADLREAEGEDPEMGYVLRMFEFVIMLGRMDMVLFDRFNDIGIYDMIFTSYLDGDELTRLTCLEVMEMMLDLLDRLRLESESAKGFILNTMELFKRNEVNDFVVPSLIQFFVSLIKIPNILSYDNINNFINYISNIILNTNHNKSDTYFIVTLSCFGPLYIGNYIKDKSVIQRFLFILNHSTSEAVIINSIDSLLFILEGKTIPKSNDDFFFNKRLGMKGRFNDDSQYDDVPLNYPEEPSNFVFNKNISNETPAVSPDILQTIHNKCHTTNPPEVHPAVSSSNCLPVNGNATPGDRGDDGGVVDLTSSGEPAADLREAKGEVNRKASTASGKTSGGEADGRNVTSSVTEGCESVEQNLCRESSLGFSLRCDEMFIYKSTMIVVGLLNKFPFANVRVHCYLYFTLLMDFINEDLLNLLIKEELNNKLFSKSEDDYNVTNTKKKFLKN